MNRSEKAVFTALLSNIAELYSKPLSPSMLEIYWTIFKDYPLENIKSAIHRHLLDHTQGKFMPKPADLLKYFEKSLEEKASNAWTQVSAAIGFFGAHESVIFEDNLIHAVIADMGGWIRLCHIQESQLFFEEKEFKRRYVSYQYHPPTTCPAQLKGLYNHENPVRINLKEDPLRLDFKRGETEND